ncbi:MAG: type II secretion system protein [Planctomycetes bacterium]|nr:type II secretion system protein [Planctomycetota bacterium]
MRKHAFTVVELLVVVAIIGALMMILLPNLAAALERARQAQCAANLRSIGQSIKVYSSGNRGKWPSVYPSGEGEWGEDYDPEDPVISDYEGTKDKDPEDMAEEGYDFQCNLSCLYLLIRKGMSSPAVFQCPSADYRVDMEDTDYENLWSFQLASNVCYSYQNQVGKGTTDSADSAMIVAADVNPMRTDLIEEMSDRAEDRNINQDDERYKLNSPNHDFEGQNCLYADGHVEWQTNPYVGVRGNNIWTMSVYDPSAEEEDEAWEEEEGPGNYDDPIGSKKDTWLVP